MRAVLTYHSVDDSGSPISVSEQAFRRHVTWFASGRVPVVPLEKILKVPEDGDAVALTFDDGFVNFRSVAWPLLREHGLPVTLFVPTGHVGRDNAWGGEEQPGIPTLPLMDWASLARLAEEGLNLGSHGALHRDLRQVGDAELHDELQTAAARIESETGSAPAAFAYPYGAHDARCVAAARRLHALACTTEMRTLGSREDPLRLPRLDAYYFQGAGRLEGWGSARFRGWLRLRAAARRVRAALAPPPAGERG